MSYAIPIAILISNGNGKQHHLKLKMVLFCINLFLVKRIILSETGKDGKRFCLKRFGMFDGTASKFLLATYSAG